MIYSLFPFQIQRNQLAIQEIDDNLKTHEKKILDYQVLSGRRETNIHLNNMILQWGLPRHCLISKCDTLSLDWWGFHSNS